MSFAMEPTRYRPTSEALLRPGVAGKGLYFINGEEDSCSLSSRGFLGEAQ